MRMSGRLEVHVEIDPALECAAIPPLSVATLVENAVKHGLAPLSAGGRIRIAASTQNAKLQLSVADNGVGFKTDSAGGSGIGLYNVQARLRTLHGSAASLRVMAAQPNGVQAIMTLPFRVMPA
jgi:LytS/YehU family sensor histidine kinase